MNSIIKGNENGRCFICGKYCQTECHHIFGGANRKKSEKLGLKIDLCHQCHNEPPCGVHFDKIINIYIKALGQQQAMQFYNWTIEKFIQEIGRNYI